MNFLDLQAEDISILLAHALQEQRENTMLCAYLLKQNTELQAALRRIAQMENPPGGERTLPFLEQFPDRSTIVRLKAQIFENEPKQGVPRYRVKVAVWDKAEARDKMEQQRWPNGYYRNWCFNLQTRDDFYERTGSFEEIKSECWVGPLTHKQKKGTRRHLDHIAVYKPENGVLALNLLGDWLAFGEGTPLDLPKSNSPIEPEHSI
jgi:hypothetical protein